MIISQKADTNRSKISEQYVLYAVLGLLVLLVLWVFGSTYKTQAGPSYKRIFCDAEKVEGDQFLTNGQYFGGGEMQSSERARSGRYSCKFIPGGDKDYALTYNFPEVKPGEVFKASVWRFQTNGGVGRLAVHGVGDEGFYQQVEQPSLIEDGWELLEIVFHIPFGQSLERINVHVYGLGTRPVFFDDLTIEKLDQWQSEDFKPDVIELKLDDQALRKLNKKREQAIAKGLLETDNKDWVDAQLISSGTESIPVKLRLKGDWLDHLESGKWSFRVKTKAPHTWKRMRTFSLHTPKARYFLHEWLLHQLWEQEDVLTTRYDFVELKLNGNTLGLYAYEEHFEKQLVEYRQRREGPILKFSEDAFWAGLKRQLNAHGFIRPETEHTEGFWENADILPFDEGVIESDSLMRQQFLQAQNLLYQYKYGIKKASEVFDIDRLAKYYAICDLLNAYHGIVWHNQRFYYNPLTNKLEPIGFDGFGDKPQEQYTILGTGALDPNKLFDQTIFSHLFLDPAFAEKYIQYLNRFSSRDYYEGIVDSLGSGIGPRQAFLALEFPDYKLDLSQLAQQFNFIRSLLLPYNQYSIQAFANTNNQLLIRNRHSLPIRIVGYGNNTRQPTHRLQKKKVLAAQIPRKFWIRQQKFDRIYNFGSLRFMEEGAWAQQSTPRYDTLLNSGPLPEVVFFQVLGIDSLFHTTVLPWQLPESKATFQSLKLDSLRIPDKIAKLKQNKILFQAGKHQISNPILIPKGYKVFFPAGTEIDLVNSAFFLSKSPVEAYGEDERPVRIYSSDGTALGFSVLQAPTASVFSNTIFENLNTLSYKGIQYTGGVTLYESDARFYRCRFLRSQSEDALNMIRSTFEMDGCLIEQTAFDGLDSDFCKGKIRNSFFQNIGNDAIDFSGSIANLKEIDINKCGDKGISVGEESDVHLQDSQIKAAPIALASKDLSLLFVRNVAIKNCDQGFVAFQKKEEFGGGKIIVESYSADGVKRLNAIAPGSSLQLGDKIIQ